MLSKIICIITTVTITGFSRSPPSSSPIPPPPPISVPVWSFATASQSKTSMNIMTFCVPVSVSSPKLWALSFYHGTLTKDSFLGCIEEDISDDAGMGDDENNVDQHRKCCSIGVLQLLKFDHRHLVSILGKKSGRDVDKSTLCSEEGFPWSRISHADTDESDDQKNEDCDFELLPGCALYVQVECRSSARLINAGDHVVAICEVKRIGVWEQIDEEELNGGKVSWLENTIEGNTIPLALGEIDESNALYSGRLREEGIL